MRISDLKFILPRLYTDEMTVHRHSKKTNVDGTTGLKVDTTPVMSAIPCRFSLKADDDALVTSGDNNSIMQELKIFCAPGTDVRKGDIITVVRKNESGVVLATFSGDANSLMPYLSHSEILMSITGNG